MKFNQCDICGAYLDPGERCTCVAEAEEEKRKAEAENRASVTKMLLSAGKPRKRKKP